MILSGPGNTGGRREHTGGPVVRLILCAGVLVLAAWAGCNVGPDYHPPQTTMPAAWGESPATAAATQPVELAQWWKKFDDPALDQVVHQAIAGNIDLRQAQWRIVEARAQRGIVAANEWPVINASGSYAREKFSRNGISNTTGGGTPGAVGGLSNKSTNLYQAGFDASWELDVFGKVRRAVEAADATISATIENRRDILVTLLSEVALNYIELRSFQRQLYITRETLRAQQETLSLTRSRYKVGVVSDLDVTQAQAQLAATAALVPILETSIRQRMHQLGVLIGRAPMALSSLAERESPIPSAPRGIPLGLPSDLLRQRADIRQSERQLAAATAQIGVAVADLFPQFSLTGNIGLDSTKLNNFVGNNSLFWGVGPSFSWTVFDAGAIRANIHVMEARQQQALAGYEQTVLTALRETEDALVAYYKEQVHRKALAEAVKADRRTLDLATKLYIHGRTDFLSVLDAQRVLYSAETSLTQSDQSLSTDLVAVYKALGGGWEGQE